MKNKVLIASLFMLPILLSVASACSCILLPDTQSKFENAAYVFTGEVVDLEKSELYGEKNQEVTIRIIQYWKPAAFPESVNMKIYAREDTGANCGYNFEEGQKYLIYSYIDTETGRLETNSCMGNLLLEEASNEIKELSEIAVPVTNTPNEVDPTENGNIIVRFFSWIKSWFS